MPETTPLEDARVELASTLEERERAEPDPDERFRILVLGDFSGRESREVDDPSDLGLERTPVRVDKDNIEELPGDLGTEVRVQLLDHGAPLAIRIATLDDFHPDRLFTETAAFAGLRKTRLALESGDSQEYEEAARGVRSWGMPGAPVGTSRPAPPQPPAPPLPNIRMPDVIKPHVRKEIDDLAQELLTRAKKRGTSEDVDALARQVVAGHLVPSAPADRDGLLATTDAAIGSWMRTLLREPLFHDLEAAWRALELLVRRVDEDTAEVHVLDVSLAELAQDLRRSDLEESGAYRVLVGDAVETEGGKPWSAVVGLWTFAPTVEDVALLGRLARIAKAAGAPFLAGASPRLAGREGFAPAGGAPSDAPQGEEADEALWHALRGMPGAEWIGLLLPRLLLRLPYGARTDPTEEFPFEEGEEASHEDLLWGSPAVACALLLALAFAQDGWDMTPGSVRDVDSLPIYVRDEEGEAKAVPCAETLLRDSEVEDLLGKGLMPLVSRRESDSVRLARFQSIRDPLTPLAGRWSS